MFPLWFPKLQNLNSWDLRDKTSIIKVESENLSCYWVLVLLRCEDKVREEKTEFI